MLIIEDEVMFPVREEDVCQRSPEVDPGKRFVIESGALLSIQSPCGCVVKVWVSGEPNAVAVKVGAPGVPPSKTA